MFKILFFTLVLFLTTSCEISNQVAQENKPVSEVIEKVNLLQKSSKQAELRLVKTKITPKTFKISIKIDNLGEQAITSVRTWLGYNPEALRVISVSDQNSDLDLFAPWENNDDMENGLIKIGRSRTGESIDLAEINVAEVVVEKLQTGATVLNFYDYHEDYSGHTTVNAILDGEIYNVLKKPELPAIVLD